MKTHIGKYIFIALSLIHASGLHAQQETPIRELGYVFQLAGDQLVEYTISGEVDGIDRKIRQISRCLANMPPQHRAHIVPIYIVPTLPGGRTTGGGWYPNNERGGANLSAWLNRRAVTGIPNSVIEDDLSRNVTGIVAITHSRFNRSTSGQPAIHYLTGLHEMAHAVEAAGQALIGDGVTVSQLAQVYPRSNVSEHAADAYSRLITRPAAVCRQRALPAGESVRACSQRVTGLLRAAPVFSSVSAAWQPLLGCHNNEALDQLASSNDGAEGAFSGSISSDDTNSGHDDEPNPGLSTAEENAHSATNTNIPQGKGLFFTAQEFVRRNDGRIVIDVEHLGSPTEFRERLNTNDIAWIAMPRNANARIFTNNIVGAFKPYANALTSANKPIHIFVWNGGPEDRNDFNAEIDRMVEGALEWGGKGIIIDPEGRFWRRSANARRLVDKARSATAEHRLSVGYTDFVGNRSWRDSAIEQYTELDYGMPQIYDRFEDQPRDYPARKITTWQSEFDVVIPLSGFHRCERRINSDSCHAVTTKTAEQARQLLSETNTPNNALGWWTHNFLVRGTGLWEVVREHTLE